MEGEATVGPSCACARVDDENVNWTGGVGGDGGAARMVQSGTRQRSRGRSLG